MATWVSRVRKWQYRLRANQKNRTRGAASMHTSCFKQARAWATKDASSIHAQCCTGTGVQGACVECGCHPCSTHVPHHVSEKQVSTVVTPKPRGCTCVCALKPRAGLPLRPPSPPVDKQKDCLSRTPGFHALHTRTRMGLGLVGTEARGRWPPGVVQVVWRTQSGWAVQRSSGGTQSTVCCPAGRQSHETWMGCLWGPGPVSG